MRSFPFRISAGVLVAIAATLASGGCAAVRAPLLVADAEKYCPLPTNYQDVHRSFNPFILLFPASWNVADQFARATVTAEAPLSKDDAVGFYQSRLTRLGWREDSQAKAWLELPEGALCFVPAKQDIQALPTRYLALEIQENTQGPTFIRVTLYARYPTDAPGLLLGAINHQWGDFYVMMHLPDKAATILTWPAGAIISALF